MISFVTPLALLLVLPFLVLILYSQRRSYTNLSLRRTRLATALRVIILTAVVLSLAGMHLRLPQSRQAAVYVADLSASDSGQRTMVQTLINNSTVQRPGSGVLGVVSVGREPVVEQPVSGLSGFSGFQSTVDPQYTNLAGGLDLANALLPPGYQHRVVVVSDGQQNVGDALSTARLLHSQGVRVDVVPVPVPGGAEVLVDRVEMPSQLRPRESYSVGVVVRSTVNTTTGLTIYRDRTVIGSYQRNVHPGENRFVFPQSPLQPGSYAYRVEIAPSVDTQPENNVGSAFVQVQSKPRVLVIAGQPQEAGNVLASLRSTGIDATVQPPAKVTPDLAYLQRYAAVVIVDTAADTLGTRLIAQLVPYVRDLGHGLVVVGGQSAYSMGGYGQTPLEQVLPVSMDIPKRQSLPTTAVVLIIESLEEDTQVNISKEAGKRVVDLLSPQDQVAVSDAPFDGGAGWVVPLQHVTNRKSISAAIDRMVPGDPETYTPMLQSAFDSLKRAKARLKHIILLGDGDAEDPSYQQLVEQIRAAGITVSTVSTNGLGRNDFQTMKSIAQWGGGRNYQANDPSKIPQIFLRETRTAARLGIVQGKFYPQELSANPMMRDLQRVSPLYGYIATTPKPAAEIVLASARLDPVLAAWQYGLGRSVAWTSDASGLWTRDWLRVPGANRFWANLVSWTLPPAGGSHLFINASSSQGEGHISVNTPSSLGSSPNVVARVLTPGLKTVAVQLEPSAPNQFSGSFQETGQGAYFVSVDAHGAGHGEAGQVGMDVSYSPEYHTTGVNTSFLQSLAAAGGGSLIAHPQDLWQSNLQSVMADYDMTLWLLLLAVLLFPIDIGVRRLIVSRKELASIRDAIPRRRRVSAAGEPALPLVGALRERRAQQGVFAPQTVSEEPRTFIVPRPGTGSRSAASRMPQTGGRIADTRPGAEPTDEAEQESIAARLLAARKNKD